VNRVERQRYDDEDQAEREIEEQTESPDERDDTEIERRAGVEAMHRVGAYPPREGAEAVYGDTDMDPNRDDQKSAHHAEADEHL